MRSNSSPATATARSLWNSIRGPATSSTPAEYANSGAANGGWPIPRGDYRLIGYKGDGTLASLGVTSAGWVRRGTTPGQQWHRPGRMAAALTLPTISPGSPANGVTTDPTARDTVNERDPQSGGPGSILNDRDFWRQPHCRHGG